ncbi:restriction endonuclease [Sphingomonas pituitosa]|uniref:restriction endonuclease n=1 Tax=Sphingomonas pituitosa TaxID=99597 RepID=UPI000835E218|nr:restriction endonuclease [Sphingomonas pituitosa]
MPEMPKYTDYMLPTLQILRDLGGSAAVEEIEEALIARLALHRKLLDQTYPRSGAPIVPDRMSWARTFLKNAGLVESGGRGIWLLTEEGRRAAGNRAEEVRRHVLDAHKVARTAAFRSASRQRKEDRVATTLSEFYAGAEGSSEWSDQLLATLRGLHPAAFERLCHRLLRESGFVKVEVTGRSGDGGIDGTGVLRMNLISFHVLFQCKRYAGSVSSPTVRDFRGAMQGRADKGLILTTGSFTADARREATRDGAPAIDLIDGETLCQLLKERGLGVRVEPVVIERVRLQPEFFSEI